MKSFLIALVLFSLMLSLLCVNGRFLSKSADALISKTEEIPFYGAAAQSSSALHDTVSALECEWERVKKPISLAVTVRFIEGVDDELGRLRSALRNGDACEFDTAKEHLLRIFEGLYQYEKIAFGGIF